MDESDSIHSTIDQWLAIALDAIAGKPFAFKQCGIRAVVFQTIFPANNG
jgi:hypothetical protein